MEVLPWYTNVVNYLVIGQLPEYWNTQDNANIFTEIKKFFCDDQIKLSDDVSWSANFRTTIHSTMNKLVEPF